MGQNKTIIKKIGNFLYTKNSESIESLINIDRILGMESNNDGGVLILMWDLRYKNEITSTIIKNTTVEDIANNIYTDNSRPGIPEIIKK